MSELTQEIAAIRQELANLKSIVLGPKKPIDILKLNARETAISGSYSDTAMMVLCFCDASETALSPVLPDAQLDKNTIFVLIKTDSTANAVTVGMVGGQTLNGATSKTLTEQNAGIMIVSDRANWLLISELPAKWSV